jgi:hypothetical protein
MARTMTIENVEFEWDGKGNVYISLNPEEILVFQFNSVEITNTETGNYINVDFYEDPISLTPILEKGSNSININFRDEEVYNDWKNSGAPYIVQSAQKKYTKVIRAHSNYGLACDSDFTCHPYLCPGGSAKIICITWNGKCDVYLSSNKEEPNLEIEGDLYVANVKLDGYEGGEIFNTPVVNITDHLEKGNNYLVAAICFSNKTAYQPMSIPDIYALEVCEEGPTTELEFTLLTEGYGDLPIYDINPNGESIFNPGYSTAFALSHFNWDGEGRVYIGSNNVSLQQESFDWGNRAQIYINCNHGYTGREGSFHWTGFDSQCKFEIINITPALEIGDNDIYWALGGISPTATYPDYENLINCPPFYYVQVRKV